MAVTKVYKETDGFCLMIELSSGGFLAEIEYPLIRFEGANVVIKDGYTDGNYFIPIADVRNSADAAIGGQTEAEVRIYIDGEMAK